MTIKVPGNPESISHGTLRNEDLVPALAGELRRLCEANDHHSHMALVQEADKWIERNSETRDIGIEPEENDNEIGSELVNDLSDALDEFAPPGHYFGNTEGDGSDFGFWPTQETDDDESHAVVLLYPETPEFKNFHHRIAYFYVQAHGREEAVRKAIEDAVEVQKDPHLLHSDMTVVCVVKGNPVFI